MKIALIIGAFTFICLLYALRQGQAQTGGIPPNSQLYVRSGHIAGQKSDKLVSISGMDFTTSQKVVSDFAKMYFRKKPLPVFELSDIGNRTTLISFSEDLNFEIFCWFVNYVQYPINESVTQKVRGWSNLNDKTDLLTEDLISKKGMFFLSPQDHEHDHVWFVTDSNEDYTIGFAGFGFIQKVNEHFYDYQSPPAVSLDDPAVTIGYTLGNRASLSSEFNSH